MIDIVQEGVQGAGALADAPVQYTPFIGGEDARQQVEGNEPFGIAAFAIDGESDADAPENRLRLVHASVEPGNAGAVHPFLHFVITGAD